MRKPFPHRTGFVVTTALVALALAAQAGLAVRAWGEVERLRLHAEVARLRAHGHPTRPNEILRDLPGPNAADELQAAAKPLDKETGADHWFNNATLKLPLTADQAKRLDEYIAQHRGDLDHVTAATTRPGVDWHIKIERPLYNTLLRSLNGQRAVANMLQGAVYAAHHNHEDHLAVERVHQLLFQTRLVARQPFIVSHLVAMGNSAQANESLAQILPHLRVGPGPSDASPAQLRKLVADLLDDRWRQQSLRACMEHERIGMFEMAELIADGEPVPAEFISVEARAGLWLASPVVLRDARDLSDYCGRAITAVANDDWPTAYHQCPTLTRTAASPLLHPFRSLAAPDLRRSIATSYRTLTERRILAVLVATRLYMADHAGTPPAALDDLVPDYLAEPPADPMTPGSAEPLRYLPDGPTVYSVGLDGVDQGGSEKVADPKAPGARWSREDVVYHLK